MSSQRSQGRRLALQILYAYDLAGDKPASLEDLIRTAAPRAPGEVMAFARTLVEGVLQLKNELDRVLQTSLDHWNIDRVHPVERNILRIGVFELTYRPEVPATVAVSEAVDLAKRFGDPDAWRLINGILDHIGKARLTVEETVAGGSGQKAGPDERNGSSLLDE
jgi:transcription antitermination protein NusB